MARVVSRRSMMLARSVLLVSTVVLTTSCRRGVLDPHGPVGQAERIILYDATAIMLAVGVPVILLTLAFAWWFREGNPRATYRPDWEYSGRIEMIIWSIPALVILFLGGMAWVGSHDLNPPRLLPGPVAPLEVEVISLDWRWLFIYPSEGIASLNRLTVPAGVPLHLRLTSTSVMNSFFVPQLGSQIYTMPGMTTQLNLLADQAAIYPGLSAQFSGEGFSDMRFDLEAMPVTGFTAWVQAHRGRGDTLDAATFAELARPGKSGKAAVIYGHVEPGLFEAISSRHRASLSVQPQS